MSSVRNRLFIVIGAMALLASLSIGAVYLATETERLDIRAESRTVADLYDLTARLSTAIRDQEAAIDDYLISDNPSSVARYRAAAEDELRLTERMGLSLIGHPNIATALTDVATESRAWRATFAEPAILAVESGDTSGIDNVKSLAAADQESTLSGVGNLITRLAEAETAVLNRDDALTRTRAVAGAVGIFLMLIAAAASLILARRWVTQPLEHLLGAAREVESGHNVPFKAERNDEIGRLGNALERMRGALQGDVDRSDILNRFTEVTTFAPDDAAVAAAGLEALQLLIQPDAAVAHVMNQSKDRAIPEATLGPAVAEVLPLNSLSHCPGVVRGSIYVTSDATAPLSVHCAIYPTDHGTLACVPLAHGETVGAVHLFWEQPNAFGLEQRAGVARVAEHAALAIGNRRLLAALQGMASTDARTGLANTRAFDQQLEDTLSARQNDETVAVLMLDLDNFKDFNDRYGHPSGDVALRTFADVLRSCLRDGDLAARYGGEEFAVVLRNVDEDTALTVAERIRGRTESTLISLAPGITDRITVSIGMSSAPHQAHDRVSLLRLADEALYNAKEAGRNRVVYLGSGPRQAPAVKAAEG